MGSIIGVFSNKTCSFSDNYNFVDSFAEGPPEKIFNKAGIGI